MNSRLILQFNEYRIIEVKETEYDLDNLKGDCFDPIVNKDIPAIELARQEHAFEQKVESVGVYGYILEKWNPEIGQGWQELDSCYGFVGPHASEGHYIVKEFLDQYQITEGLIK